MIMGLSHIALNCADIEAATNRLKTFSYTARLDEPNLENHSAKRRFLAHYQPAHHIRALAGEGAMAIELLDHGGLVGPQSSALIPVFQSPAPCEDWQPLPLMDLPVDQPGLDMIVSILGDGVQSYFDPVLSISLLWRPSNDGPSGLFAVIAPTPNQTSLQALLTQLRFRPNATGLWSLLTPLPALQARLIPVKAKPAKGWATDALLDAPGCACLALMARGTDKATLPVALQRDCVSFRLPLNGKISRITLARPEHGPIVELVDQPT